MLRRHRDILWMLLPAIGLFLGGCGCTPEIDQDQLLQQQLVDPSADQRWNAALSLREMRPVPQAYVAPLLKALDDQDPRVRQAAAEALGELGSEGRSQINQLIKISSEHPDAQVRFALEQSVSKIKRAE